MYNGIKRKQRKKFKIVFPTKFQMLQLDEEITNGIIRKNYKIKTTDLKADPNLNWYDFEVSNLIATGIDVEHQNPVTMQANKEKMADSAAAASKTLELAEIVKELETERATE